MLIQPVDVGPTGLLMEAGVLVAQGLDGLVFRSFDEVALVMEEFEGRLTVVFDDGSVAHRPGPLQPSPVPGLMPLADGVLYAPWHARRKQGQLVFAGGWTFPAVPVPRNAPRPERRDTTVRIATTSVELHRLRALRMGCKGEGFDVAIDDGSRFHISRVAAKYFAERLGLSNPSYLEPMSARHASLYRLGLRDFPYVLLEAPAGVLKSAFGTDEKLCIANLIWEAYRHRASGKPLDYGTEHRGFYYRPILAVLQRAGLLGGESTALIGLLPEEDENARVPEDVLLGDIEDGMDLVGDIEDGIELFGAGNDSHYILYDTVLSQMVGRDRLFTLRDLGFEDLRSDLRTLGTAHPECLVVAEKSSLESEARQLSQVFGVSTVVLGGMARWEAVEPVADMLRPVIGGRTVDIVTYGDYDPAGWDIDDVVVDMLSRYDIQARIVGRLVLPKRFTAKEIELVAEPLPSAPREAPRNHNWMKRTGGVDGKPLRIHADHLRPVERVIAAFVEETGMQPLASAAQK